LQSDTTVDSIEFTMIFLANKQLWSKKGVNSGNINREMQSGNFLALVISAIAVV
jgi:hypothetical protein